MAFIFPAKFFHYLFSRYCIVSREWKNIWDWYTRSSGNTLNILQWHVLYFFRCEKKELVECIFMKIFNIEISIAVIYDIFDIHELAEFTGGSSFFILLKIAF